jgi:DNA-binding response OmpR family regulator
MSLAIARESASLAHAHACPLCGTPQDTTTIDLPGLHISKRNHRVRLAGHEVKLTRTEFKLLTYLAEQPDTLITKRRLYLDVLGYVAVPRSTRTLDSHISRLRRKLADIDPLAITIENTWGAGYRLQTPRSQQ